MKIYILQDSDWEWGSEEFPAFIVEAESPDKAIAAAVEHIKLAWKDTDGIHFKVAEVQLVGFGGWCRDEGGAEKFDAFVPLSAP